MTTATSHQQYPLYERQDDNDPAKGRHLVAKRSIPKGRLIFCERPLVALQSLGNPAWVCHCCKAFVGGPYAALHILATHAFPDTTTNTIDENNHNNEEQSDWTVIPCRQKCGQVYCSKECEEDFWYARHQYLCTGNLSDDCPLIKFKQHAVTTNEIFLLVAEWIVAAFSYRERNQEKESAINNPFEDFLMEPWWELGTMEEREILKGLCEEACRLWQEHWQTTQTQQHTTTDAAAATPLYMANIIGACELNSIGIRRRSPLCRDVFSRPLRHDCKEFLLKCLAQAGLLHDNEEEEEDVDQERETSGDPSQIADLTTSSADHHNSNNPNQTTTPEPETEVPLQKHEYEYTDDDLARFLSELDIFEEETTKKPGVKLDKNDDESGCEDCQEQDDLDDIFPPMDGTAMYALTCKMNHSCDPNVVVLYKTRGWGAKHPLVAHCVALRDIEQGEELCISYIESNDPVAKRQEALKHYGFTCNCEKCQTELANDDGETPAQTTQEIKSTLNRQDDDFLFGSDDSDDEDAELTIKATDNGSTAVDSSNPAEPSCGEDALEQCLGRLDTVLNNFSMGSIPLPFLAQASTFIIQTATLAQTNLQDEKDDLVVKDLLSNCADALQDRDFVLCKTVGADLEQFLFSMLQKHSSWPSLSFREGYWCAAMTASVGLTHQCSFLPALYFLDKATLLGLDRRKVDEFYSYVEYHASHVAIGPVEPAIDTIVPDFASLSYRTLIADTGLSQPIQFPLPEVDESSLEMAYISNSKPALVREYATGWPAVKKWRDLASFCRNHGHRLVPIEIGSMSSKTGMKEELMTLRSFISEYLVPSCAKDCWSLRDAAEMQQNVAYLAQHPLIDQLPSLSEDINMTPAPCGAMGPSHVYLWVGTGGTRTPLHFDSYSNLFVQIVGAKYVRIYSQEESPKLYIGQKKSYSLQGNMSDVDCEQEDYEQFPLAKDAEYQEVLLLPGDALYIPARAWHYVRSLSTSISVNFWF